MLGRILQIRHGESRRAALLFTYLFLVIASSVITKSARDPIFQEQFGSNNLPYVDMVSALFVAAVMGVYLRLSRRLGVRPVVNGSLLISAVWSLGFWFIARVREPYWMLPVLYVWASVASVLLPAQVWALANQVMTTREAKRLFGIVSSGAISGWIVGGLVIRSVVSRTSTADLLLPTALALAVCPLLVEAIWRESRMDRAAHAGPRTGESRYAVAESLGLIWKSRHLRAVATLIGIASLVTTITGWQFKTVAHIYRPNTDQLATFYGNFNVYAGILALLTQLLIAPRLLRRFGLGVALLMVPVALVAGSFGLMLSGTLLSVILMNGSDVIARRSINQPTVEMLYLPVPANQVARAKAVIDTVVWRSGDGLGALLLIVAVKIAGLTVFEVSAIVLVLLAGWIAAAVTARRHYVHSLRTSIYEHRLDAEQLSSQRAERSTTEVLIATLDSGEPERLLYALNLLEQHEPPIAHPAVARLVAHPAPAVRRKAIAVLAAADDVSAVAQVEPLLRDEDGGVRAEALVYMARCGRVDPLTQVKDLDDTDSGAMASAITHFLAQPGPAQNLEAVRVLLDLATGNDDPDLHQARLEAARLIGSLPDQFEIQLNSLLADRSVDVVRLAIRAVANVGKPSSIQLVVGRLGHPDLAVDAADTLAILGDRAIPSLREALADESGPGGVRHAIPDVLQRIATPEAEQLLVEYILDVDPVLRLRSISALNKLRQLTGDRRLEHELVETVLAAEILGHYRSYQLLDRLSTAEANDEAARTRVKESMDQELERIFRLMKLLLPEHDLHSAYFGLQSTNAVVHANALEFLEHALPARFRTLLLPLIDSEVSLAERIRIADRMVGATAETSEQALAAFTASDEMLRDVAKKAELQLEDSHPERV